MICASVPLRDVLTHIDTTLAPEDRGPVSGIVRREPPPLTPTHEIDPYDLDDIVHLLVKRRSAA